MAASRPSSSRDTILDAAQRVALRDGSPNLTLDAVARESGVSKGGLLYHFPNKDALVAAMVQRLADTLTATMEEVRPAFADRPCPTLHALLEANRQRERMEALAPAALLAAAAERPELMAPIRNAFEGFLTRIEEETADPDLALLMWAAADGLLLQLLLGVAPFPESRHADLVDRLHAVADVRLR